VRDLLAAIRYAYGIAKRARRAGRTFNSQLELELEELLRTHRLRLVTAAMRRRVAEGELTLHDRVLELYEELHDA
jgi:hypothetical protein